MPYAREVRCLGRGVLLAQQIRSKAKVGEKLLKISSGFKTDWNRPDFVKRLTRSHGTVPFVLPKNLGLCYWAWLLAAGQEQGSQGAWCVFVTRPLLIALHRCCCDLGTSSQPAHPAKHSPSFPFAVVNMFAFGSWLLTSQTSLGFKCVIPQFSQQISQDKTLTFEATCNLIQLK